MTDVTRIRGAPGCGKTTRLVEICEEERDRGLGPFDLYYTTFGRSAVSETEAELVEVFANSDAKPDHIRSRARTFHSIAYGLAGREGIVGEDDEVITQRQDAELYQRFANRHGLSFDPHASDPLRASTTGTAPAGNRLFRIHARLAALVEEPKYCQRKVPIDLPASREETVEMLKAWEGYKREGGPEGYDAPRLFEHHDYVQELIDGGITPDVDVMLFDEFQDFSPQEYLLYKTWRDSGDLERVYIAGDANQSIYGFKAASPDFFVGTDADEEELLKRSYRCPSAVVDVARGVLEGYPSTDHGGFRSRHDGGEVVRSAIDDPDTLASLVAKEARRNAGSGGDASVFLLARMHYQVREIADALRAGGVPFQRLGSARSNWTKRLGRVYQALNHLQRGEHVPARAAKTLLDTARGRREEKMAGKGGVHWATVDVENQMFAAEDLRQAFPECSQASEIVGTLSLSDRRLDELRAALGSGYDLQPEQVKIGTMHAAKGLEAPCVFLSVETSSNILEQYEKGNSAAEEHRLHYVGATRASETLYLLHNYFGTEVFPPFRHGVPQSLEVEA